MLESIIKSPSLEWIVNTYQESNSLLFENLWDSPKAILAAFFQKSLKNNLLIITEGNRRDLLYLDLHFFHKHPIVEFLSWDTFLEDEITPSLDIIGTRMEALDQILHKKNLIILAPLQAVLQKIPIPQSLKSKLQTISAHDEIGFDPFIQKLISLGYTRQTVVSDKGEFAVRGGIIDLFPISSKNPFRIDFFGDTIEKIRSFDVADQKSIEKVPSFFLCPANEKDLLEKESLTTLLEYLGKETTIIFDDLLKIEDDYVLNKERSSKYQLNIHEFFKLTENYKKVFFSSENIESLSPTKKEKKDRKSETITFEILHEKITTERIFHPFVRPHDYLIPPDSEDDFILNHLEKNTLTFFISTSQREEDFLKELLDNKINNSQFFKGTLSSGLVVTDIPLIIFPESERTKKVFPRRQVYRNSHHTPEVEFHHLSAGDYVVHLYSGIGKYQGIEEQKNAEGVPSEYLVIEYAENSKLYVPMNQAHLVSRYIGASETTPDLNKLGSKKWENTRLLAQKQIIGYAQELLELEANRVIKGGVSYPKDSQTLIQFEEEFPYKETEDQKRAIFDVKKDLEKEQAMNRLVLGDVGYGKTEVALRAAFKVAFDGKKQVAVLVPTTVLAMQHYETFRQRILDYPLKVEVLCRHQKKTKKILEELEKGTVDIVVGTHRLLSEDIVFKDLGLLIIDEEQRFGVKAKEKLKKVKEGVDTLTLSATPIPRTLYMSLIQIRDLSVISTPPYDRLPIKTVLADSDDALIKNALIRELSREGQAFFIHNRVESIDLRKAHLEKMIPQAKFAVVHGQMSSDLVDDIFTAFRAGEIDVLVATSIVENGIDVPNANTIIIDDATMFGLADLYQFRGRVGRWNRPSYAYFLIPKHKKPSLTSQKRLSVLAQNSGYGAGLKIAMRDLEIRGAGDILGVKQSGQISAIGFHLYCKLLRQTITALKDKKPIHFNETKMEFSFDAKLPDNYIKESSLRMEIYHKIGDSKSFEQIDEVYKEIIDRFGKPPESVVYLYHLSRLKIFCSNNHFTLLKFQNISFLAKQALGKKKEEKNIMLPKQFHPPGKLEPYVIESLKKHFQCS